MMVNTQSFADNIYAYGDGLSFVMFFFP